VADRLVVVEVTGAVVVDGLVVVEDELFSLPHPAAERATTGTAMMEALRVSME